MPAAKKRQAVKRGFKKDVKTSADNAEEKFEGLERGTSFIFGAIGIALLASAGSGFTGGVIGTDVGKNLAVGLIGTFSIIAALGLFLKSFKK